MLLFGLSGGIATGKSTVSAELRKSFTVIDCDVVARQVVQKACYILFLLLVPVLDLFRQN
jgi:dephospho-CoA kinase